MSSEGVYVILPVARLIRAHSEAFKEAGVELLLSPPGFELCVTDRDDWFDTLYQTAAWLNEDLIQQILYRAAIDLEVRAEMLTIVRLGSTPFDLRAYLRAIGPVLDEGLTAPGGR